MRRTPQMLSCLTLLALAAAPAAHASTSSDGGWEWVAAPYLWMASQTTDASEDAEPVPNETSFSSIIDKLDFAFQGHVEGQGERFGVFGDITYIALSDNKSFTRFDTNASMDTTLFEVAGVWNVEPERYQGLDLFLGVRHLIADFTLTIKPAAGQTFPQAEVGFDQSYTDVMAGVRYTAKLGETWNMITRVDGGWGDTDGTVNASVMFGRELGAGSLMVGYRYFDVEASKGTTDLDVTMQGPVLAYAFGL